MVLLPWEQQEEESVCVWWGGGPAPNPPPLTAGALRNMLSLSLTYTHTLSFSVVCG